MGLALSALFPPWFYRCEPPYSPSSRSPGYHFFLRPPPTVPCTTSDPLFGPPATVHINVGRLTYQCIFIVILTAGLLIIFKVPKTNLSLVTGAIILGIGIIGIIPVAIDLVYQR